MRTIPIRKLTLCAVLTATSMILTRLLAIPIGDSLRFSLGNVPILLAGIWLGPIAGALVGFAADLLGSFLLSGLGWYPPLALSPVLVGLLAGLLKPLLLRPLTLWRVALMTSITCLVTSLGWTTLALTWLYGTFSFGELLLMRAPLSLAMLCVEAALVYLLCKRMGTETQFIARRHGVDE